MVDFLAENNTCGQAILHLVSRGNAIIAEILRLSEFVPPVFKADNFNRDEFSKYSDLISDFSYFKTIEFFENRVSTKLGLEDLDEEFKENYIEILTRFYQAFESIHKYICDLNRYLEELEEGVYIQQTIELVLQNEDGKQLLCEAIYLYGVMLLVTDLRMDGLIREKMLVSYYRYSTSRISSESNIDDVCKLLRSTGFSSTGNNNQRRPINYPENLFNRIPISSNFLSMLIGRLRSDDIYNQVSAYPLPQHRSAALSNQAAAFYVILYFRPDVLQEQNATMREIVDKFFPDNWVLSIYMGININLIEAWAPYKAAFMALSNTIDLNNVKQLSSKHSKNALALIEGLEKILKPGILTEEFALDHLSKLMNYLRESNVCLRWLIMHTASLNNLETVKKCRQIRESVLQESSSCDMEKIFSLLLNTAEFEFRVKEMFKKMLDEKKKTWDQHKNECLDRMKELAEVFQGSKPLSRVDKNEKLQAWFEEMGKQISLLDYEDSTAEGRKIIQLIQALEEVQEFHQLESIVEVKQFLLESRKHLHQLIRTANIKEDILITIQIIADLSYAWELIDSFTQIMQNDIKRDPILVTKLRATFLKLASALDLPLMRINQAKSPDLISVSQYYSGELVIYVRKVLQIIPESMFGLLAEIIELQTNKIKELPTRLDKDKIKDFMQLDDRFQVAKLTNSISIFTEGMLMMKTTLVGIIEIDPKRLLEDGIRKELVNKVSEALHRSLVFNSRAKTSELSIKLEEIGSKMDGFRRSFEYIQDYVNIYGLKIWQEEVSRIINYNVEQECNSFLRNKIQDWQSIYQSIAIPIPKYIPLEGSVNFIGRLTRELLRITDPKSTIYIDQSSAWFDYKSKLEVVNVKLFEKLEKSVGTWGMVGLDRLLSFMIVQTLQNLVSTFEKGILKDKLIVEALNKTSKSTDLNNGAFVQRQKLFSNLHTKLAKYFPQFLEAILKVGQMQLLRRQISYQLSCLCKFDSKFLNASLLNFNKVLLSEVKGHYNDPSRPYPEESNPLMYELTKYLEATGINDPLSKIYMTTKSVQYFPLMVFIMINSQLQKLTFLKSINGLIGRKASDGIDGLPFVVGCVSLMKQFNLENTQQLLTFLSNYILSFANFSANIIPNDIIPEIVTLVVFLDSFLLYSGLGRKAIETQMSDILIDFLKNLTVQ